MRSMTTRAGLCPLLRWRVIQFLVRSSRVLQVSPMVKYSALTLFADRFYPALTSLEDGKGTENWLLHPIGESNLQLFALISLWVTSKLHDTPPLSVKSLKLLSDKYIKEQHYTNGDLLEAFVEKVLKFGIGTSNIAFVLVEELIAQLTVVARVGEHVKFEACMDVMDLLYECEEMTPLFHSSPQALAASVVVVAYVITVPLQMWEFPVVPWVVFASTCKEMELLDRIKIILKHIFEH
ncbi:Cyclin-J18 [Striga hermonthica]|uniref:Cyclin-J18 n=1 Tax=Striga hermonthica TaxID=68872 RepID=A0A9N7NF87_STRHE|nr:Cyclin-J18 [Striga hermonthica]